VRRRKTQEIAFRLIHTFSYKKLSLIIDEIPSPLYVFVIRVFYKAFLVTSLRGGREVGRVCLYWLFLNVLLSILGIQKLYLVPYD